MAGVTTRELGPLTSTNVTLTGNTFQQNECNQAIANLLLDVDVVPTVQPPCCSTISCPTYTSTCTNSKGVSTRVTTLLKGLQPQREVPSKDRGKRFCTGNLAGDKQLHVPGNDVQEFQFWTLFPTSQALKNAKVFLLGQISLTMCDGKPCQSAEKNPSTEVIRDYIPSSDTYNASGKTALLKATAVLQMDVTNYVLCDNQAVTLSVDSIEELHSYVPFSSDVDIESRLATVAYY